jgi:NAD(P)-dependent dehydrogenase (short-subunit alcohol dehydrogenase family)
MWRKIVYDLAGKVTLVTGASNKRGIGRGIALRLAREGADVIVNDKRKSPEDIDLWDKEEGWHGLDSLVEEIEALGCRSLAITADVSNSLEVNVMIRKAVEKFARIDILVNNAALVARDIGTAPVVDMSEEVWTRTIAVNLTGVFLMCKAVVGQMIEQGGGGKIINIASLMGKMAMPGRAAYSASKFGVIGLTQALAQEVASHNIKVNAVCPGSTATWGSKGHAIFEAMHQGLSEKEAVAKIYADAGSLAQIPLGRPAKVEDVANVVAFLASDQSDYMTGQAVNVTGGRLMAH